MSRTAPRLRATAASVFIIAGTSLIGASAASARAHVSLAVRSAHRSHSAERDRRDRTPRLVSWNFTATEFFAAPGQPFPVGSSTLARIVYNPRQVDANGDVAILGHQHFLGSAWADPNGPAGTPVSNRSVFNVNALTLNYQVAVTHGLPIVLVYTPLKFVGIYSQSDGSMLEGGHYVFDPAGPEPCNARTWFQNGTC